MYTKYSELFDVPRTIRTIDLKPGMTVGNGCGCLTLIKAIHPFSSGLSQVIIEHRDPTNCKLGHVTHSLPYIFRPPMEKAFLFTEEMN